MCLAFADCQVPRPQWSVDTGSCFEAEREGYLRDGEHCVPKCAPDYYASVSVLSCVGEQMVPEAFVCPLVPMATRAHESIEDIPDSFRISRCLREANACSYEAGRAVDLKDTQRQIHKKMYFLPAASLHWGSQTKMTTVTVGNALGLFKFLLEMLA